MFQWRNRVRDGSAVPVFGRRCCRAGSIVGRSFVASTAENDEEANGYCNYSGDQSANRDACFGTRGEGGADGRWGKGVGEGEYFGADDADGGIRGIGGGGGGNKREGRGTIAWGLAREVGAVNGPAP